MAPQLINYLPKDSRFAVNWSSYMQGIQLLQLQTTYYVSGKLSVNFRI